MSGPELVFALAPGKSVLARETAEALTFELKQLGARARISVGGLPEHRSGVVTVLLSPHEFLALNGVQPQAPALRRCILLDPDDLKLGHSKAWDRRDEVPERDIDVLFIGRATVRRERALAAYADTLERLNCHLLLCDDTEASEGGVDFVAGEAKLKLLARSKVLLNVHAEEEPCFEWSRVGPAISAGCAVVTEHSTDIGPLRPGTDVLSARPAALGLLAAWLAEDEAARERIVAAADEQLRAHAPLAEEAAVLLATAQRIDGTPVDSLEARSAAAAATRMSLQRPPAPAGQGSPEPDPVQPILRALKRQHSETLSLRRQLAADALARERPQQPRAETVEVAASPARRDLPPPRVSVVVPLFNDEEVIREALDSVHRSALSSWEVVVVDDASTDGGPAAVLAWIDAHPDRRVALVRHEVNRGLSSARNTGIAHSRADLLLMLDSDNRIRRGGISRLVSALDQDPAASFAYGILDCFTIEEPVGLISKFGWDPARLREGNYIDALAMFRRAALEEMGGYSTDSRLALGLEDYDLWARLAEAGHSGAFVRHFVGSYRVGHSSMRSITGISSMDAVTAIAEHAPTLMRGVELPA